MSHIVFCEGKNDVSFVRTLLKSSDCTFDINEFVIEEFLKLEGGGPLVPRETTEIRRFIGRDDLGDVLIKSEGNKSNLLKVFTTLLVDLCSYDFDFMLVIDRDGDDLNDVLDQLNGHIGSRYGGSISVEARASLDLGSDLKLAQCSVTGSSGLEGHFTLLAFAQSLEVAAGINKERDREGIQETITQYIEDNDELSDLVDDSKAFRDPNWWL